LSFERIRRINDAGAEHWSSRDFAGVLGYTDYRNFEQVIGKARLACFNSGQRIEDHFGDITEMIGIGSGAQRPLKTMRPFCACQQNGGPRFRRKAGNRGYCIDAVCLPDEIR